MNPVVLTACADIFLAVALLAALVRTSIQRRYLREQERRLRQQEARMVQVLVDLAKKGLS